MPTVGAPRDRAGQNRRRAKHLIDFDNPSPQVRPRGGMTLTHVQMWIMSTLAVSTLLHFSGGLVAAAFYVEESRRVDRIGLLIIAGLVGVISVFAGRAIHHKKFLSWWLLLGWAPTLIGAYLLFGRQGT